MASTEINNRHIICISSVDWDPLWTRKQQVMSRLPESNTILYVEPPVTLLSPFKDPSMWSKWRAWFKGIRPLPAQKNIFLYSPPVTLPFGNKSRLINRINQWWISLFLKRVISKLRIRNPILWTYMPNTADLLNYIEHDLLVYDCVDEHSEYTGLINKQVMIDMERDLMAECDIVFVTAPGLYEDKKAFAKNIYYLPNAANVEHFNKALAPETKIPPDIRDIPKPIVGFVGVIQDWIDLDLIKAIAVRYPEWSVVLVGPVGVGVDISGLAALPNVYLLGRKDIKDLPGYLKAFDLCINPFKLNALTDKVSPLKFYEYLASGKPIVSVDMPGVREFSDIIYIAHNKEEFVDYVKMAINTEDEGKQKKRLAAAARNSWESRVRFMMEKINLCFK